MEVIVLMLSVAAGVAMNDWRVFAGGVVVVGLMQWLKDEWLHHHIHDTFNKEDDIWEDENGDKTIS